jgi:hypothetical protein
MGFFKVSYERLGCGISEELVGGWEWDFCFYGVGYRVSEEANFETST